VRKRGWVAARNSGVSKASRTEGSPSGARDGGRTRFGGRGPARPEVPVARSEAEASSRNEGLPGNGARVLCGRSRGLINAPLPAVRCRCEPWASASAAIQLLLSQAAAPAARIGEPAGPGRGLRRLALCRRGLSNSSRAQSRSDGMGPYATAALLEERRIRARVFCVLAARGAAFPPFGDSLNEGVRVGGCPEGGRAGGGRRLRALPSGAAAPPAERSGAGQCSSAPAGELASWRAFLCVAAQRAAAFTPGRNERQRMKPAWKSCRAAESASRNSSAGWRACERAAAPCSAQALFNVPGER
jgi:hypothetical protein